MKKFFVLLMCVLCVPFAALAESTETTLWEGEQTLGNWEGYVHVEASSFASASAGDNINVTVSSIDADLSLWPQVMIQNSSWAAFDDCPSQLATTTGVLSFEITSSMLESLKSGGAIVKGAYVTITKITLSQESGSGSATGGSVSEAVKSIWSGSNNISWNTGEQSWQTIGADAFSSATTGMLLRFNISGVQIGAQGHICTSSWSDMPDATDYFQISGAYYQFTITDAMLAELQANGVIITGVGYTLTSVELIDESKLPSISCTFNSEDIREWLVGETVALRVNLTNNEATEQDVTVTVNLSTDKAVSVGTYTATETIAAGASAIAKVELPITEAGVYHIVAVANYSQLASYNIAYNLTGISSPADAQSDFSEYWQTALTQLAAVEPEYTLTEIPEKSTDARKAYLVEMKSIPDGLTGEPVIIRGYYLEPTGTGTYPAIITYNGYDSDGTSTPYCPSGDENPGYVEFSLSTRGQLINNRDPYENTYGDWFAFNFGNKDSYYYRGAYMDAVRAVDFICSREKVDQDAIFAQGQSQGGALTIAATALTGKFQAIAPAIPFMGDFPDYFQVGEWPRSVALANQGTMTDEEMYTFLSYYDTKNMAPQITCPTIFTLSLQDNVCPPHTNIAAYNNLGSTEKEYSVNTMLQHSVPSTWYNAYIEYFENHISSKYESVTVTDIEAATLVLPFDAIIPEGVKAYTLTYTSGSSADATEVSGTLSANTPVLINAEAGTYTFEATSTLNKEDEPVEGALYGVWEETYVPAGSYVLQSQNGNVGFYKVEKDNTVKLGANKAYLTATGSTAKSISISFGDATGIDSVSEKSAVENIKVYNLQGVLMDDTSLSKGIYVKGGKKVVIK